MTAKDRNGILEYFFRHIAGNYKIVARSGFASGHEDTPLWKASLLTLDEREKSGWSAKDIADRLIKLRETGVKYSTLSEAIPPVLDSRNEKVNILDSDRTYVHPALKIISSPSYDEDTGEIISAGEVKRVSSFTFGDLVNYYVNTLKPSFIDRKRLAGVLSHYLSIGTDLDMLLRAIDLWESGSTDTSRGNNPFELTEWINEAIAERDGMVSSKNINDEDVE